MASPPEKTISYPDVQAQDPTFLIRQVFVNTSPGSNTVPSGMVISDTKRPRLQGMGVSEGVGVSGCGVDVCGSPGPGSGVSVMVSESPLTDSVAVTALAATVFATEASMVAVWSAEEIDLPGILHAVRETISKMTIAGNRNVFFIVCLPEQNSFT